MAHEYTTWAYAQDIHGAGRKFVLVALADTANADGYSYPGQKRLATQTGQSERSVREHVDWLEEHGYIKRAERRRSDGSRTSDAYYLPPRTPTGEICRWEPTGKSLQANRQISPNSPAESAGHEPSVEPPGEPSASTTPPAYSQPTPPEAEVEEAEYEPKNLPKLKRKNPKAARKLEEVAKACGWQFKFKVYASKHLLRTPDAAMAALDATGKRANGSGGGAYSYFESILAGGGPRLNGHAKEPDQARAMRKNIGRRAKHPELGEVEITSVALNAEHYNTPDGPVKPEDIQWLA